MLCRQNNGFGTYCPCSIFVSEQENLGMSKTDLALSHRQTVPKKYPRAGGGLSPPHKSAHNALLCTDSKGNQASKTSTAGVPLPPFCYALPVVLFLASCIARTRRGNNRIHKTPSNTNTSAETKEGSKARKHNRKTQQRESKNKHEKRKAKAKPIGLLY